MSVSTIGDYDLDSVAALIFMERRYLLQHRENRNDIAFPNCWGLFGGACEAGEGASEALRREMLEELNLEIVSYQPLMRCSYDLWFENRRTRKAFFCVELEEAQATGMVLREGQGMGWFRFEEIMAQADQIVPYDLSAIAVHARGLVRGGFLGRPERHD